MIDARQPFLPWLLVEGLAYRWKLWLVPVVVAPLAALLTLAVMPERYKSTAKVLVKEKNAVRAFGGELMSELTLQRQAAVVESVLLSRDSLKKVLRQTGRIAEGEAPRTADARIRALKERLAVNALGSELIQIDLIDESPDAARRGLELLIQDFTAAMARPQKEMLDEAFSFLQHELTRVRGELDSAEEELAAFKQRHARDLPGFQQANQESYQTYNRALVEAEIQLQTALRKKATLGARLSGVTPVAQEIENLSATVAMLKDRIQKSDTALRELPGNEKILTRLIRDTEIKSTVYKNLLAKHEDLQISKALAAFSEGGQAWVLDPPSRPSTPLGPGWLPAVLAAEAGGLLLGVLLVLVADFLLMQVRRSEEIEQLIGVPVIGIIPRMGDRGLAGVGAGGRG